LAEAFVLLISQFWSDKVLQCTEFAFMIRWGGAWLLPESDVKSYSETTGLMA